MHTFGANRSATIDDAVQVVASAFAQAAGPAVDAWKAQLAETEERLSLDIDVLRETNAELSEELEDTQLQLMMTR